MSLKTIMVVMDTTAGVEQRLDIALQLAQSHDAHLTGLCVRTTPYVPQFVMGQLGPEVAEAQRKWSIEAAETAQKLFESKAAAAGVRYEWRAVDGQLLEQTSLHAKYADLVVVSQFDPDGEMADGQDQLVDHLVLDAGRPVLVVPYCGTFASVGKTVMVAWNATREATRAVSDALPFLQKADRVNVVAVNPHGGTGRNGHGEIPSADICLSLARHGVKADAQSIEAHDMQVGDTLLSRITDEGVDLLVMGAYGRSRLRELVLGGATRHVLRHMTVPVLMSH
ncbi:universal stress protein [Insolitispirillum peregrinum]|uniref:Nucleotide-binding universal stress protein, UspA family n=1 Tax=Insolitispirillum peregrinum TaxID=80876 RepID=A0A1N7Q4Y2_9PROT|nr:universal stress protein [Insolitispirillum peregrinum]SIT17769.1 Nucleotide-binding universal stress protein, UspA family [Insolitispirillum peregrinum]